jgi:short-subunit dehydrogenase
MSKAGRTALITGASAGLGREFARLAARDGHALVLVARRHDRLEELASELTLAHGVAVSSMAMDLADKSAPQQIAERVRSAGTEIDFLINNAGFGTHGAFSRSDLGRELGIIDVNVRALVELTHLFLPGMLGRQRGRILNVASVAGFVPGPWMATYYASKAFVLSFTEALAYELRGTGVTATAACPGPTATEFGAVAQSERTNLFRGVPADAVAVARHGYRAMLAGKVVAIPGVKNKLIAQSIRVGPRVVVRGIAAHLNRAKSK